MLLHHTLWHHLKQGRIDETLERVAAEIVKNGEAYQAEQDKRRKAREEYRQNQKARKEKERV